MMVAVPHIIPKTVRNVRNFCCLISRINSESNDIGDIHLCCFMVTILYSYNLWIYLTVNL